MDKNSLTRKMNTLDDESFRALIIALGGATGIKKEKIDMLTADIPKLRNRISNMSDEQINRVLASLSGVI